MYDLSIALVCMNYPWTRNKRCPFPIGWQLREQLVNLKRHTVSGLSAYRQASLLLILRIWSIIELTSNNERKQRATRKCADNHLLAVVEAP